MSDDTINFSTEQDLLAELTAPAAFAKTSELNTSAAGRDVTRFPFYRDSFVEAKKSDGAARKTASAADQAALQNLNQDLQALSAQRRVDWALKHLPGEFALTSSFGIQAAVSLHLLTREYPDIPVILIDTGYLFAETYQFIDQLASLMNLNLKVYRAEVSPAWQEARHGKRWEQGVPGLADYNRQNKVEPLQRALGELNTKTWFAGLRREQSDTRAQLPIVRSVDGRYAVYPIADWSNREIHQYMRQHNLPFHPLWERGYVSVGDIHSTSILLDGMREQDTRFNGLQRECGIHSLSGGDMI